MKLIEKLLGEYQNSNIFDGYYIGYKIPQISKEFDLLRVTKNSIINIELKSGSGEESIKKQLTHEHERYPFQLESVEGVCIAIAHRRDNDDDKLIVVPAGTEFTDEQIMAAIHFQEQWFDTVIVR